MSRADIGGRSAAAGAPPESDMDAPSKEPVRATPAVSSRASAATVRCPSPAASAPVERIRKSWPFSRKNAPENRPVPAGRVPAKRDESPTGMAPQPSGGPSASARLSPASAASNADSAARLFRPMRTSSNAA